MLEVFKPLLRWPADHLACRLEARAVTPAIPGALGFIPRDDTAEVRVNRGMDVRLAIIVAKGRGFTAMDAHDLPLATREPVEIAALRSSEMARDARTAENQAAVFTQQRRASATLQACAMQPRTVNGSSASKISLIEPMHAPEHQHVRVIALQRNFRMTISFRRDVSVHELLSPQSPCVE